MTIVPSWTVLDLLIVERMFQIRNHLYALAIRGSGTTWYGWRGSKAMEENEEHAVTRRLRDAKGLLKL